MMAERVRTTVVNESSLPSGWQADGRYVYCGRPGEWGNPHRIGIKCAPCGGAYHTRGSAIAAHRSDVLKAWESDPAYRARMLEQLAGNYLVCFCSPHACHCDVYAELINGALEAHRRD